MFKAIYFRTEASYTKYKLATNVIQSHDPFNMIVMDSADKTPGLTTEIKNTFTFADIESIPNNRAILSISKIEKSYWDEAVTYLKVNNIVTVEELYNMSFIIVEIPKGTYESFEYKLMSSSVSFNYIEQDQLEKVDLHYAIPYSSHWHLGNVDAQCAWDAMSSFGTSNAEEPSCEPVPFSITPSTCCTKPEVALLDQGVQRFHPDLHGMLSGCVWDSETSTFEEDYNWNVLYNNNNIDPVSSYENHGTSMAGVIASNNLNNNYGLSVSQNYVRVQVLKVLYVASAGTSNPVYTGISASIQGINRAVQNPRCAAINMSFGSNQSYQPFQDAITYARTYGRGGKGIPVFAAAGNGSCNGGCAAVVNQIKYPAMYLDANAVGASGTADTKMTWSDFGTKLFVAAPGSAILTTDRTGAAGYTTVIAGTSSNVDANNTNLAVYNSSGTSVACCIVSSIAACMVAVNPNITAEQIETIIGDTAAQTGGYTYNAITGKSPELGHGVIRMCTAIQDVIDNIDGATVPVLTLNITSSAITTTTCGTTTITFTLSAEDDIWNNAVSFFYNVWSSSSSGVNPGMIPFANGVISLSEAGTYSIVLTIPNNPLIITNTDYFVLGVYLYDASGQVITATSSNTAVNDGINIEDSVVATVTNGCPTPGTDLSVQVLSYRLVTNNLGQTNRVFKIKYTNTGTVTITSFNRTYGWVGGMTATNTQTYSGTTSSTTPLLSGQSRTAEISFVGSTTPPGYPATYFHQINTVNGSPDSNPTNNNATIIVTQ
jgi:hypothetical protein